MNHIPKPLIVSEPPLADWQKQIIRYMQKQTEEDWTAHDNTSGWFNGEYYWRMGI